MSDSTDSLLDSFPDGSSALVIGATGGIGSALAQLVCTAPQFERVYTTGRSAVDNHHEKARAVSLDLTDEATIQEAVENLDPDYPLSLVIIATGLLHDGPDLQPEKSWRSIDAQSMARSFAINCTGPALVLKHVLPILKRGERSVVASLSARVGSIGDNRLGGWYAYRSAKAALNMIIKTASVELARTNKTASVIGLHPGTVDTALSIPFQANVPEGKLFDKTRAARQLLKVVNQTTEAHSGNVYDWRGHVVPH